MKTNKELKEAYKQQKPIIGVFQIKNKLSGKLLIEASTNIPAKWNRHQTELKFGSHRNAALQKDWNTDGADNFVFTILSELKIKEDEHINVNNELKILKDMVTEELNVSPEMKY